MITKKIVDSEKIELISFDIFDTVLLRLCREPEDIFAKMYYSKRELFPDDFSADDWVNLRKITEQNARKDIFEKKGNYEVSLSDIYDKLPCFINNIKELMELECEEEIRNSFLNREIYELIQEMSKNNKIILTSDMYLSKDTIIKMLLKSGFDMKYIEDIYISNEYSKSKRNRELYKLILDEYNIKPYQMLHVGDNCESDIAIAKQVGINTYHYTLISEAKYDYPYLEYEQLAYEYIDNDSYSVRILSANQNDNFWYKTGAMVMGPFLSYFALWIVKKAQNENIKIIRPLMREGEFLSKLIEQAAEHLNVRLDVKPIYVSRFTLYKALFDEITEKEIEYLYSTQGITLEEVFDILKIKEYTLEFSAYYSFKVIDLMAIGYEKTSMYDRILEWLICEKRIQLIREKNKNSSELILKYFDENKLIGNKVITVDIGWRGSMQKAINTLLEKKGLKNNIKHIVCIAKPDCANSMYPNTNIEGYFGKCGDEYGITFSMLSRIYEMFMLSDKGTTVGYIKEDKCIKPITKQINYCEEQIKSIRLLQKGIFDFQNNYAKHICNLTIDELKKKAKPAIVICERLMCFPTHEEVKYLKNIEYDQNFGTNTFFKILSDEIINEYMNYDKETYEELNLNQGIVWRSGLYSFVEPLYYYKLLYRINMKYSFGAYLRIIEKSVKRAKENNEKIILVGAGENLKLYINYIEAMDERELLLGICDNDKAKEGATYRGIPVEMVDNIEKKGVFVCTLKNQAAFDSLEKQLKSRLGKKIDYYGYTR